jgi:hypothetical protein
MRIPVTAIPTMRGITGKLANASAPEEVAGVDPDGADEPAEPAADPGGCTGGA